jgi:16S rRNA (adenine1518-N6/adenine1519-N6)-dimethyltransferase
LAAFNQRRKTIRNGFKNLISVAQLEALNIDANLRPENLTLDDYIMLANFIVDNPPEPIKVNSKKLSRRAMKRAEEQD